MHILSPVTDNCPSWKSGRRNESMLPDRVSNPGPLTYESGALPIALRGPAHVVWIAQWMPGRVAQSVAHLTLKPEAPGSMAGRPATFVSPPADSRRTVVSYWRKLLLPGLTDRPDMTITVYRRRNTKTQQQSSIKYIWFFFFFSFCFSLLIARHHVITSRLCERILEITFATLFDTEHLHTDVR